MKNELLKINKLSKKFHTKNQEITAIEDLSFKVYENEILAIVGPSGCGKSTLLSILANLENKSSGDIKKNNNLKIGYMLQTDSLFPWLTVLDNTLIGLEITKERNKDTITNVIYLLEKYGLADFINSYPDNLSGGMKQRVL